jgi:hypothetical protein
MLLLMNAPVALAQDSCRLSVQSGRIEKQKAPADGQGLRASLPVASLGSEAASNNWRLGVLAPAAQSSQALLQRRCCPLQDAGVLRFHARDQALAIRFLQHLLVAHSRVHCVNVGKHRPTSFHDQS